MVKAYTSTVIAQPADYIWHIIRDFGTIASWHPALRDSRMEYNHPGDKVGSIRALTLMDGGKVRETLLALSDYEYKITYDILTSPMPLTDYHATLQLHPITDNNHTFAEWLAEFECSPTDQDTLVNLVANDVFKVGLDNLKNM